MENRLYNIIFDNIYKINPAVGYDDLHHYLLKCYYDFFQIPGKIYAFGAEDNKVYITSFKSRLDDERKRGRRLQDIDILKLLSSKFKKDVISSVQINMKLCLYLWKTNFVCISTAYDVYLISSDEKEAYKFLELLEIKKESLDEITYRFVTIGERGIEKHLLSFDKIEVDINKYYNSDLPWTKIQNFVGTSEEGLILLYGCPGSGKTSLLKYIIQENQDKEFYLIQGKDLIDIKNTNLFTFFFRHPNSIFILEDCEELLAQRTRGTDLSTLLNLTDGIIGSSLKLRFICTFNTNIGNIDKAILRKGRLKLKYEFGPLSLEKTQALSPGATKKMVLADIFNKEDVDFSADKKIGF